jgi:hypothetical protein
MIREASVIMVDCDLYASARTALHFSADLIVDEAVVFFDDWADAELAAKGLGERRAFEEFQAANPALSVRTGELPRELARFSRNEIERDRHPHLVGDGQDPTPPVLWGMSDCARLVSVPIMHHQDEASGVLVEESDVMRVSVIGAGYVGARHRCVPGGERTPSRVRRWRRAEGCRGQLRHLRPDKVPATDRADV